MTAHLQRTVRTPDGRTLAVEEAGDPDGRPVLVHMGSPNSRHLYEPNGADAAARGLRLICYDRPGFGGSTPQPGRTVASCAADVRAICAGLDISQAAMWAFPAVARTSWPARRCSPTWSWRPPRWRHWLPSVPRAWTGSRAWARPTSMTSGCWKPTRPRPASNWRPIARKCWPPPPRSRPRCWPHC